MCGNVEGPHAISAGVRSRPATQERVGACTPCLHAALDPFRACGLDSRHPAVCVCVCLARSYASFDYEAGPYREADLVRLDILAHGQVGCVTTLPWPSPERASAFTLGSDVDGSYVPSRAACPVDVPGKVHSPPGQSARAGCDPWKPARGCACPSRATRSTRAHSEPVGGSCSQAPL